MPSDEGLLDRLVDWLPKTLVFKRVASWILVPLWAPWTNRNGVCWATS
jgi:hypothetical protein